MPRVFATVLAVAVLAACSAKEAPETMEGEAVGILIDEAPWFLVEAARKKIPGFALTGASMDEEGGKTTYELTGVAGGKRYELELDSDGNILEVNEG